jgi:hypothetical protein
LNKEIETNIRTNIGMNENQRNIERKSSLTIPAIATISAVSGSGSFKIVYVIIILFIVFVIGLLFYYKDLFEHYFNILFSNSSAKTSDTNIKKDAQESQESKNAAKAEVTHAKVESTSAKIDDLDKKVDKLIDSKTCSTSSAPSTINTLNDKINDVSPYKEANVTANGFCYIGYDNGQRECVDVYAGDVCMSGEIFPSLDICINPKMRK